MSIQLRLNVDSRTRLQFSCDVQAPTLRATRSFPEHHYRMMQQDSDVVIKLVVTLHAASTWAMFGLIWFVQVVHYPLFVFARAHFTDFETQHRSLTGIVVAPLMLLELFTATLLLLPSFGVGVGLRCAGFALLGVVWLSTVLLQVPMHNLLNEGYYAAAHKRLVATNWARTAAWSLRALLAAIMLWEGLS
jgi:hypothetical protein